jgi:hypothetical protein
MTVTINNLTTATTLSNGDLLPVWPAADQDTRKTTVSALLTLLQAGLTVPGTLSQQYAAPSSTGFTVLLTAADMWLVLTPTAGFAAGTITLPAVRTNRQVIQVSCTQSVTTLTVSGNGTTVTGAPATLAANAFFRLQYDATTNAWYRVG